MSNNLTKTSCKDCIFAIYENKTQVGCEHGRIEKFGSEVIEAYDNDAEFFVINRLCNYVRSKNWNDGILDKNKAEAESAVSFDIFIDVNELSLDEKDAIIKTLNNVDYYKNKIKVLLCHNNSVTKLDRENILSLFYSINNVTLSVYDDKYQYIDSIIKKSNSTFHAVFKPSELGIINFALKYINDLVNNDLQRMVLVKYNNIMFISNMACRIMYNRIYEDFDHQIKEIVNDAKKNKMFIEEHKEEN